MVGAVASGARGAGVTFVGQLLRFAIQFTSVVVLSRLLAPEDFGLVAMVVVFVAFGEMIRDFGMSTIGLQRRHLTHQQASNLFWVTTALGFATGLMLVASTPLLVDLYNEPRLAGIVPALAPTLLLSGVASQIRVQLARAMRYTALTAVEVGAQLLMLATAVACALIGLAYWAIVVATLVSAAATLAGYWAFARWIPTRPRRGAASRALVKDGAAFGVAQFLNYLSENLDTLVIGARWGATSVGVYTRAYQLLSLPVSRLIAPLTQVVIPTVNRAMAEGRTMDAVLMRIQFAVGVVVVWAFAVTAATAEWLVPVLLGSEWSASVPIFQALAVGGMVRVFSNVNYWRTILGNLGKQLVVFNVVTKLLVVASIIFASFYSVEAVAWAVSIGFVVTWPLALLWFGRIADWDSWLYFREGIRILFPGFAVYIGGRVLFTALPVNGLGAALCTAAIMTIVFVAGIWLVKGGPDRLGAMARTGRGMIKRN